MDTKQRLEITLSLAVIVLAVLAIISFIYAGAGPVFYLLFIFTVIVMVYMWRTTNAPAAVAAHTPLRGTASSSPVPSWNKRKSGSASKKGRA
jgi:hypothetical protein